MGGRRSPGWIIGVALASMLVGAFVVVRLQKARAVVHGAPTTSGSVVVALDAAVLESQVVLPELVPLSPDVDASAPLALAATVTAVPTASPAMTLIAETPKAPSLAKSAEEGTTPPHDNTPVTRRIGVSHTLGVHRHLVEAEVTREIGRIRPSLDACYVAPECARSSTPWCIDSVQEKRAEFLVSVETTGRVERVQGPSGLRLANCVGTALRTMQFSPYTRQTLEGRDDFTLVIEIR